MKKIKWITIRDTTLSSAGNDVSLTECEKKEIAVKVVDKKGEEIKEYRYVKGNKQQKVVITMKFHWKPADYQENDSNDVVYCLKQSDNWAINNEKQAITTKLGKESKFQEAKKEAHKKLLQRYFSDKIGKKKEEGEISGTDLQYVIGDNVEGGKINVIIYGKNTDAPNDTHFNWDEVEIKPQFWLTKQVDFDSIISTTNCQEGENKPKLTKGWIAFFIILVIIIALGIIFWKKIWKWFRGEREQEKKVREQIDIF